MTDWSEGYLTEVEYLYTYHSHLNPLQMQLAMVSAGLAPPAVATACELGGRSEWSESAVHLEVLVPLTDTLKIEG